MNTKAIRNGILQVLFLVAILFFLIMTPQLHASMMVFNSSVPSYNTATRTDWLNAAGITVPQYLVDFETGFINGQNIHGITGLFPAGLVIEDSSSAHGAIIRSGSTVIGGSNPVGTFSLTQNEKPYLELVFSSSPIDYLAFQDIDQAGTTGKVTFVGGATATFSFETTATGGDSAEFVGLFRNDMPRITKVQLDATGDELWGIDTIEYGSAVPIPGAIWLFGPGLAGIFGIRRRFMK
jgi:hypothetical protein